MSPTKIICGLLFFVLGGPGFLGAQPQVKTTTMPTIPYVDSTSPQVRRDRRQKITVEDLRQYPNHDPRAAFFVVERDGCWRLVDPLISQKLR